jgi:sugar phosphate isomerase/epimerase
MKKVGSLKFNRYKFINHYKNKKKMKKATTFKFWCSGIKAIAALVFVVFMIQSSATASGKKGSKFGGVQIGTITYSYRSMPDQSISSILNYVVQSGLSSVELMGGPVEQYAGIPQVKDAQVIRNWRAAVSMDKFKAIRKMFNAKGVKIDILKLGEGKWSDEEIDYAFNVCKTLGARGITMEISEETAKRMAPFAVKHNLFVIFHNHGQPGDPNFSFDKALAYGPKLMLNFDAGHYFGATGLDPALLIARLHNRIASIHIKDKTGPKASEPNKNEQFGKGETPVVEILQLIQKNKWPITCDIELEYNIPEGSDAVKEVIKCVAYCRTALLPKK